MVAAYLGDLGLTGGVRLLEIGCGTGAIARVLAAWPGVGEVVGLDPSPILLARAQELGEGIANLSFEQGTAAARCSRTPPSTRWCCIACCRTSPTPMRSWRRRIA